jgi:CHAT domain-containing protein
MTYRISLIVCILLRMVAAGNPGDPRNRLIALYRGADSLFHLSHSTTATDSMAFAGFNLVIDGCRKLQGGGGGNDGLLAGALLRKGILLDAAGNYPGAGACYSAALRTGAKDDSLAFVAQVYLGAIHYNLNHFDSASYYLLQAQSLADHFPDRDDEVRLFNTLGVLYYDNGNYREARDYFDKALAIVRGKKPVDQAYAVSLQTNIATSAFRLGQYPEALAIYHDLLSYRPLTNYVYMNMGRAYAGLNDYSRAVACFRNVDPAKIPWVLNEMANAQERLRRPDSCAWYLHRLQELAKSHPQGFNVRDLGINAQYTADWQSDQGNYEAALGSLQRAIEIFSQNFHDPSIYANPVDFSGTFAYYRLFDVLAEKAALFRRLYATRPDTAYLLASYHAYMSALSLLRHIEKSYATDEAKLFLKSKSGPAHAGALAVCLQLDALQPDHEFGEQAFLISERSKASVITANLEEKAFTAPGSRGQQLLQLVNDYKYNIARLNVKSESTTDSAGLAGLTQEKEGDELKLSKLENALEQNSAYYELKYGESDRGVRELQQSLDGDQALISLYGTDSVLHAWILTRDHFHYLRIDNLPGLEQDVTLWLNALKNTGNGHRFRGDAIGNRLYKRLIEPIQQVAGSKPEWIIIPDGFLYLLPWESLPADAAGERRLVETTTVSYRWSSKLLRSAQGTGTTVLAFAPFASGGATTPGDGNFSRLPASAEEIAGLGGSRYLDGQATKTRFLQTINHYPIVHLATHAVSSPDNAAASYIAFYPAKHSAIEDRLYLEELYGLNMDSTRLVIISACETGEGAVVAQEGVISLARAFAYAGCGSTINSLWKADDQATSFILRRFYEHLRKGESKARALQLAKLDFLHSDAVDKSPAYWAHLVLTGDSGPIYGSGAFVKWRWLVVGLVLLFGGALVVVSARRKRGKKKSRRFV